MRGRATPGASGLAHMVLSEPYIIALALTVAGVLLALSALSSNLSTRAGVPAVLVYLGVGMLAGSEGPGGLVFTDHTMALRIGTVALVLILFDGGLNTTYDLVRRAIGPASVLATLGVVLTALLVSLPARLLGFGWLEALLLGSVVASTDASAVFSILRGSRLQLRRRVAATLDLESGLNDPIAVILTIGLTGAIVTTDPPGSELLVDLVYQLVVGAAVGWAIGRAGRWVLARSRMAIESLYPVLTTALALLAFGLPTLAGASGFLAVFIAGVVLGNGELPYRGNILRAHDFLAWFSQVFMFLTMGLLVFPSDLLVVAPAGLAIGAFLAFIGRPLTVALCLAPFRFPWREQAYIGWVGLRGAVPIILATFPLVAGVPAGDRIFQLVFFVVALSVGVQGVTAAWLARRLGLRGPPAPFPPAVLEISSARLDRVDVLHFSVHPALMVAGARLADLPLPERAAILLVIRGEEMMAPRDGLRLAAGDHIYVLCRREDQARVRLLFGHELEDS